MAGINDRVRVFLDSWPIIKEKIEVTSNLRLEKDEDERLFHSDGVGESLWCKLQDDLPAPLGPGDSGL
jgi:hypothetical protein